MKTELGAIPYIYPIPIVLAGANVDGNPNFVTIGDTGLMGITPPIVFISSHVNHHTNKGILENKTFSINMPTTDLLKEVDYCGIVSGADVDKSELFEVFYGQTESAPMIVECPVNLECRLIKEFCIQHRQVFVGEVIQAYANSEYVETQGERKRIADLSQLDPIAYALDNRYYSIGTPIGHGYQEGQNLK